MTTMSGGALIRVIVESIGVLTILRDVEHNLDAGASSVCACCRGS
jgi:hypothetical protein